MCQGVTSNLSMIYHFDRRNDVKFVKEFKCIRREYSLAVVKVM